MIRRLDELETARKTAIHGGDGAAITGDYLKNGEMGGVVTAGRVVLEPGASIGNHPHRNHDEIYLVLDGHGTGILDGSRFAISPGDMYVLKAGQSHGMLNDSEQPLVFFMLMTKGNDGA